MHRWFTLPIRVEVRPPPGFCSGRFWNTRVRRRGMPLGHPAIAMQPRSPHGTLPQPCNWPALLPSGDLHKASNAGYPQAKTLAESIPGSGSRDRVAELCDCCSNPTPATLTRRAHGHLARCRRRIASSCETMSYHCFGSAAGRRWMGRVGRGVDGPEIALAGAAERGSPCQFRPSSKLPNRAW